MAFQRNPLKIKITERKRKYPTYRYIFPPTVVQLKCPFNHRSPPDSSTINSVKYRNRVPVAAYIQPPSKK